MSLSTIRKAKVSFFSLEIDNEMKQIMHIKYIDTVKKVMKLPKINVKFPNGAINLKGGK